MQVEEVDTIEWFTLPCTFLIIAKRMSGKSHLLKWMMKQFNAMGSFDFGMIISATAEANHEWDIIPKEFIISNYNEQYVENFLALGKKKKKEGKKFNSFIIFDDFIGTVNLKTPFMSQFIATARHYNISSFFISQKMTDAIPPILRLNADYIFIFKNGNKVELQNIHKEWTGNFGDGSFDDFFQWMDTNIENYRVLVIDKRIQSNKSKDVYRTIKAPEKFGDFFFDFKVKNQEKSKQKKPNLNKAKSETILQRVLGKNYSGPEL